MRSVSEVFQKLYIAVSNLSASPNNTPAYTILVQDNMFQFHRELIWEKENTPFGQEYAKLQKLKRVYFK